MAPPGAAGRGRLGDTGFADELSVLDGVVVALSDGAEASIRRPGR